MPKSRLDKAPFEYDPDEFLDPLEMRYVLEALDVVRKRHLKVDLSGVYEAIAARDLFPKRKSPFRQIANAFFSMGVAVNRGELLKKDPETQEPICADALQELADE